MKTILVAEDDLFISDLAKQKLTAAGFNVTVVADGDLVLETIVQANPDIVLLDIDLPHVDGVTLLKAIRADASMAAVPVVVFTNNDDAALKAEVEALGATHFLKALTGTDELVTAVKSAT